MLNADYIRFQLEIRWGFIQFSFTIRAIFIQKSYDNRKQSVKVSFNSHYDMKSYYYICIAGRVLDDSAQFYKISVGTSIQANRDLLFLTAYAVDHNCYFERVSQETTDFIGKCAMSIHPGEFIEAMSQLNLRLVDARALVRALKKSLSVDDDEASGVNAARVLENLSLNYRVFRAMRSR